MKSTDVGRLTEIAQRLRSYLAKPRSSYGIAISAVAVLWSTVFSGLMIDDLLQRPVAQGRLPLPGGPLNLFAFVRRDPPWRAIFLEAGAYPWWIGPQTQFIYFRPLASLTHFIDYRWWPRAAWFMHVENLAWYAALILLSAKFYRRFIRLPWAAGVAAAFYAFDQAHASPVSWICNRNALMATVFGLVAMMAHDEWRTKGRRSFAAIAVVAFVLALLSCEAGIAIAGYLLAYPLFMERGNVRKRALSVTGYVAATVVWRAVYAMNGYGVAGSGVSCDPLTDPILYVVRTVQSVPLLIASDLTCVPAEVLWQYVGHLPLLAIASTAVLLLLGYALWPLLRRDRPAQFLAAGTLMSAIPMGGVIPSDRYVFWVGLGIMGLVACLAGFVAEAATRGIRSPTTVQHRVYIACIVLRGFISPMAMPFRALEWAVAENQYEQLASTFPNLPDVSKKTVVLLNAPVEVFATTLPLIRYAMGYPMPAHQYLLYAGVDAIRISRIDSHTIDVASARGWLPKEIDRSLRKEPFQAGEVVRLDRMQAEVRRVLPNGQAAVVRFSFGDALDDPSMIFVAWGRRGLARVDLPAEGSLTLPAPPLVLEGTLTPRLRLRAVEEDQSQSSLR